MKYLYLLMFAIIILMAAQKTQRLIVVCLKSITQIIVFTH